MVEDGAKHTLVLYNCKVPQTGEVAFSAANASCKANLKVKGESSPPLAQRFPFSFEHLLSFYFLLHEC